MELTPMTRRPMLLRALAMTVLGLVVAVAADAQQPGSRFRVLVPALEAQGGARPNFGQDVANEVIRAVDGLATHAAVPRREMQEALRRVGIRNERDLDCIRARQLAVQMGVELVMCGEFSQGAGGNQVAARFISARSGETFEVESFSAANARQAGQQIFESFERYINQLRLTSFCVDYLGSSQWENARGMCGQALELNPQSMTAMYGVARALMELDSLDRSLAMLQDLLEINPVHQDALLAAGFVATRLDRRDVARNYYHQYLEMNPGNVDVRLQVALELAKAGDPEEALRFVREGLEAEPENLTLQEYGGHFALAAAQRLTQSGANGDRSPEVSSLFEQAVRYYQTVFEAKGAAELDATMLRNMIVALSQGLERHRDAIALGERITAQRTDDANIWGAYADALARGDRIRDAITALERAVQINPDYENVYARRGMWLIQTGDVSRIPQAREAFQQAVRRGEQQADALARSVFGWAYTNRYRTGQQDVAIEYFNLARDLATEPVTRGMPKFWTGYVIFQRAQRAQEASTLQSAQQTLPMFRQALQLFQDSDTRAYGAREPSTNLNRLIENTQQFIEIQEALIRRGR
jgi:tetratricopeptide (TPR) repeat protein